MKAHGYSSALVLGLGLSGEAAVQLLLEEGCAVRAVDRASSPVLERRAHALRAAGAEVHLGVGDLASVVRHDPACGGVPDVCIVSPGIAAADPWLKPVTERGIALLSELELGASRCTAPLVAITGSNGKSTCTRLLGRVLEAGGCRAVLAGNYGVPLCAVAREKEAQPDWIVAEVSSFQLETVQEFSPKVAVLLNIQPDHLDRHGNMEVYSRIKMRVFEHLHAGQQAVVHEDLLALARSSARGRPAWATFGSGPAADYRYVDGQIRYRESGQARWVALRDTVFDNDVTGLTAAATLAVARCAGVAAECVAQGARAYNPLPHRMQEIGGKRGVVFIDDSKATNLAAMCGALKMVGRPVRLIAGGILKEGRLDGAKEMLVKAVKRVYLVGQSACEMERAWGAAVECRQCGDIDNAVRMAWEDAEDGDAVLLSPGCASFDQFKDYADRGERFKDAVTKLLSRGDFRS